MPWRRVAAFILLICISLELPASGARNRNVLLLISDNQSWPDCGYCGNNDVRTPHIDRLAGDSVQFPQAFATTASCGPSRAVIYTGLHAHVNGQYGHGHGYHTFRLKPGVQTVFSLLSENGYRTALLGKQHVTPAEAYPFSFDPRINGRDVMALAEAGARFIRAAGDEPFFLVIGYSDPHPTSREGDGWGIVREYGGVEPIEYDPASLSVPAYLPDRPEVRAGLAGYYQQISRLDQGIGRMLDLLDETGHADDTLVIFTSDHGSSEPGAMANHYEPGIRVPFLVRYPHVSPGARTCGALVTLADIVPTILDWTETDRPDDELHGRSLLPILDEPSPPGWDEVYLSHVFHEVTMYYPMRTIRTRRYKLIWNIAWRLEFPHPVDTLERATWRGVVERNDEFCGRRPVSQLMFRDELELYDLDADPHEVHNLASDPESAPIRDELAAKLAHFCERTGDPWLIRQSVPRGDAYGRHPRK